MKTTERKLRTLIRKSILKEYGDSTYRYGSAPARGNATLPTDSSWFEFAKALDIGVLDLDDMAYDLGFSDFKDMDISIAPGDLAKRDPVSFAAAARESSMLAQDMSDNQILGAANMPGMV